METNVNTSLKTRLIYLLLAVISLSGNVFAQTTDEPLGGKPPTDMKSSIQDYYYQLKYMRAFELAVWSMPAVSIYGFRRATLAIGGDNNTILAWSKVAVPNAELLTANNVTPYILAMTDLQKGPVVVEIPAATDKAVLYGPLEPWFNKTWKPNDFKLVNN